MKSTHVLCVALTIFFVSVFQCDVSLAQEPARTQTRRDTIESYDSATRLMTISVELSFQGRLSSHMAFDIPRGLIGEPSFNWEGAGTCRRRNTQFTCSGDITSVQYSYRYQESARGRDNFIRYTSSWGLFSLTADTTFDLFYPPSLAFLRALRTNGIELEPNIEEPGHLQWVKKNESSRFFLNVEFQTCGNNGDPCIQVRVDPILGCVMDDGHSFNPDFWNSDPDTIESNNCYAYATNKYKPSGGRVTMAQPGTGGGMPITYAPDGSTKDVTCQGITIRAQADGLTPSDCDSPCFGGRKIALVVAPDPDNNDYHWYREDSIMSWSHKPGSTDAQNFDASGAAITDPRKADRDYGPLGANYTEFCTCFCTNPFCGELIE